MAGTWTPIPRFSGPTTIGVKHSRFAYDPVRLQMYWGGGDQARTGRVETWAFTPGDPEGIRLSNDCRPAPEIMPAFPDNIVWVYDTVGQNIIAMKGFFNYSNGLEQEARCGIAPSDPRVINNDCRLNRTTLQWSAAPWGLSPSGQGGDTTRTFGVFDPTTRKLIASQHDGWGNNIVVLDLNNNTWFRRRGGTGTSADDIVGTDNYKMRHGELAHRQSAIDVAGRCVYWPGTKSGNYLLRYNIDTTIMDIASNNLPAEYLTVLSDQEKYMVFDPGNRVLIIPNTTNYDGLMNNLLICDVDNNFSWTVEPVPQGLFPSVHNGVIAANSFGFHAGQGVMVGMGRRGPVATAGPGAPTHYWTYSFGGPPPPTTYTVRVRALPVVQTAFPVGTVGGSWKFTCVQVSGPVNQTQLVANPGPVDFSGLLAGTYTFRAVRMLSGNTVEAGTAWSAVVTVPVVVADTVEPIVTITAPLDAATLTGFALLTFTATDNVAVTLVRAYCYPEGQSHDPTILIVNPDGLGGWEAVINTQLFPDGGDFTIVAEAEDAADNIGSDFVTVSLDNIPEPERSEDRLMAASVGVM